MTLAIDGDTHRAYEVELPAGPPGVVHVRERAISALGDRLTVQLVVRALNELVERRDTPHAFHCLQREGGVELAPDGLIDDG